MAFPNKNWHQLSKQEADSGERWTITWDTKRRAETENRNTAVEKLQSAALDRAKHLLRLGFIVYEIRGPGPVVLEEAEINQRLAPQPKVVKAAPRLPPGDLPGLE
jgi:hypothetical protein